jgi:hypothetical protein
VNEVGQHGWQYELGFTPAEGGVGWYRTFADPGELIYLPPAAGASDALAALARGVGCWGGLLRADPQEFPDSCRGFLEGAEEFILNAALHAVREESADDGENYAQICDDEDMQGHALMVVARMRRAQAAITAAYRAGDAEALTAAMVALAGHVEGIPGVVAAAVDGSGVQVTVAGATLRLAARTLGGVSLTNPGRWEVLCEVEDLPAFIAVAVNEVMG